VQEQIRGFERRIAAFLTISPTIFEQTCVYAVGRKKKLCPPFENNKPGGNEPPGPGV